MSLGSYTLAALIRMVRTRVRAYTAQDVGKAEIVEILNEKQDEIFLMMSDEMKRRWYGSSAKLTFAIGTDADDLQYWVDDLPIDCWGDVALSRAVYTNVPPLDPYVVRHPVDKVNTFQELDEYITNPFKKRLSYYGPVASEAIDSSGAYLVYGVKVYVSFSSDISAHLAYIRRPVKMTDALNLDLPDQFVSFLIVITTSAVVASLELEKQAKDMALQILAMQERNARRLAGLSDSKPEDTGTVE